MFVPFEDMPGIARLWIYQANRAFQPNERAAIEAGLVHLCETWTAHGAPLKSSFRIEHDQFVVLAVDERDAGASGCSIDGSVRFLKDLQTRLGLDFFDRRHVAFQDQNTIVLHPLDRLKTLFESGVLTSDSVTFNTSMITKSDWELNWKVSARNSWLSRYLPKAAGVSGPA